MYFIDDVTDPEWKIVRQREPRSRRVTSEMGGETLSAAGRVNAAVQPVGLRPVCAEGSTEEVPQPIPAAIVEQVMAEEDVDEEDNPNAETDDCDEIEEIEVQERTLPSNDDRGGAGAAETGYGQQS